MGRRVIRRLLLVVGDGLLIAAVLPVLALVLFPESWRTGLMASTLLSLPAGAMCLLAAAGLKPGYSRR